MTLTTLIFALLAVPQTSHGSGGPVMLDFTATWCGPCQQMRPVVARLVQDGYPIQAVDVDKNRDLADRYDVTGYPTFVVIDRATGRELGRAVGARPADDLVALFDRSRSKLKASTRPGADAAGAGNDELEPAEARPPAPEVEDRPEPTASGGPNPKPWETGVRIKVHGNGAIGFGSGTVISSSPEETIVLTCAHIFKVEGQNAIPPSKFRNPITVELFDGVLNERQQVHFNNEAYAGQAIDYDFGRDVGLIRIRPGRRLPAAHVVPAHWTPKRGMGMTTVGCSEGRDATAWSTKVLNPNLHGLNGNTRYNALECTTAPKQGRSGGGLFTEDGYVAGVCDFAEPQGNHGLYAAPASIYQILDRNNLSALYEPVGLGREVIAAKTRPVPRTAAAITRAQSPDRDEPGDATLPPPEFVGVVPPVLAASNPRTGGTALTPNRQGWSNTPARVAGYRRDPAADSSSYSPPAEVPTETPTPQPSPVRTRAAGKWNSGLPPAVGPLADPEG